MTTSFNLSLVFLIDSQETVKMA